MKNRAGIYAGSAIVGVSICGSIFLIEMAARYGDYASEQDPARLMVVSHLVADSGLDPKILGPDADLPQTTKTNARDDRAVLAEQALLAHLDDESSNNLDIERMFMAGVGATILFGLGGGVQIVRAATSESLGATLANEQSGVPEET